MLSKCLRTVLTSRSVLLCGSKIKPTPDKLVRCHHYIPADQYDIPIPKRLHIFYVMRVYWETIPLFFVTTLSFTCCFIAINWAIFHKVDVVFTTHSRNTISRTMDLRNPTVHKMRIMTTTIPAWPEMADVLDKMKAAEKKALSKATACPHE